MPIYWNPEDPRDVRYVPLWDGWSWSTKDSLTLAMVVLFVAFLVLPFLP